jgi:vitamin-K-epoxide reductase (warfarin-sensitive)
MNKLKQQKLLKFVFFLSILGIVVSGYLTYIHYSVLSSPCDFSETFQCSLVSRSQYSEFLGIPVAIFGMLGYAFLGLVSFGSYNTKYRFKKLKDNIFFKRIISAKTLLVFSVIALLVSLYLTYTEFFLIKALCLFCLISQSIIIGITIISYQNNNLSKKVKEEMLNGIN